MSDIDNHARLARRTAVTAATLTLGIALVLISTYQASAIAGLVAGAAITQLNIFWLARGLAQFDKGYTYVGMASLTAATLLRFFAVSILAGLAMSQPKLSPIAVIAGLLLFPCAIVISAMSLLRAVMSVAPVPKVTHVR